MVVRLTLTEPIEALVRWRGEHEATFELVDTLVDSITFQAVVRFAGAPTAAADTPSGGFERRPARTRRG
jgi:hypothetical protein